MKTMGLIPKGLLFAGLCLCSLVFTVLFAFPTLHEPGRLLLEGTGMHVPLRTIRYHMAHGPGGEKVQTISKLISKFYRLHIVFLSLLLANVFAQWVTLDSTWVLYSASFLPIIVLHAYGGYLILRAESNI